MAASEPATTSAETVKRPQTAYFLWLGEHRAEVVKALGGVNKGSEVSKKAGEMWKALSEEEKAPYELRAKEAREAYDAQKPAKLEKAAKEAGPETRKKPLNPLFAFIQAKRTEIQAMEGIKGLGDVSKKGAELFKALPEEEKAVWQKKYEEEMKEFKAWAEGEEGKAALAEKRGAAKEKRNAKKEKEEKKTTKATRKEKSNEAAPAKAAPAKAVTKAAAAPKKRAAESPAAGAPSPKAATGKGRGRGRGAGGEPTEQSSVAPAVLKEAEALGSGKPWMQNESERRWDPFMRCTID